jgi:hypothetical protein
MFALPRFQRARNATRLENAIRKMMMSAMTSRFQLRGSGFFGGRRLSLSLSALLSDIFLASSHVQLNIMTTATAVPIIASPIISPVAIM